LSYVYLFHTFTCPKQQLMLPSEERTLIQLLNQSNVKAFDTLFYHYHKRIYNFCLKFISSKAEAEEIVQIVFIAVWENRKDIDPEKLFSAYIFSIARHHAYNAIKKLTYQKAYLEQLINNGLNFDFNTEETIYFNELEDLIEKLISQLPPRRKEIFVLSRQKGLTYVEIAKKLDITENTVDTQLRKALDFIRPELVKLFL